jgi:hypothetical protein
MLSWTIFPKMERSWIALSRVSFILHFELSPRHRCFESTLLHGGIGCFSSRPSHSRNCREKLPCMVESTGADCLLFMRFAWFMFFALPWGYIVYTVVNNKKNFSCIFLHVVTLCWYLAPRSRYRTRAVLSFRKKNAMIDEELRSLEVDNIVFALDLYRSKGLCRNMLNELFLKCCKNCAMGCFQLFSAWLGNHRRKPGVVGVQLQSF